MMIHKETSFGNDLNINSNRVISDVDTLLTNGNNDLSLKPKTVILTLPSKRLIRCSKVRLKSIIYSLLSNPDMLGKENCLLHDEN